MEKVNIFQSYMRMSPIKLKTNRPHPVPRRGCKSLLRLEDGDKPHPYTGGTPLKIPQGGARCFFILSQRR